MDLKVPFKGRARFSRPCSTYSRHLVVRASEPVSYEMAVVKLTPTSFSECRGNENELLNVSRFIIYRKKTQPVQKINK